MQSYITRDLLKVLGITVSDQEIDMLVTHLRDVVDERIGAEVIAALDDARLNELMNLRRTASEADVAAWIVAHVPNLKEIVQDNVDIVLGELAENVDGINHHTQ